MHSYRIILGCCALLLLPVLPSHSQPAPDQGQPNLTPRNLNTPRDFPVITTRQQWLDRAREIREQILVSSGLWPLPERIGLHAHIFGKVVRDGYSVEKVYLQTWPGFYLAGNLYRPLGKGDGPFPAILNPHGHWENGRLADTETGSIPARCISFARQGMIAFSYDMVGYNDTRFADSPTLPDFSKAHRHFATSDPANQLWNISLMGLQTWDSLCALDFLELLPDADESRLAVTGESGGGTQTFILGAIDNRLAAQAPVVMVSHTMQGGCVCENMPGLRVEYSNVEIAAVAAPRPQIMVAATGDWTKTMPTMEGPAVEGIYRLFNAPKKLRYVQFDFPHNYNKTSREAVYAWFDTYLLRHPDSSAAKEAPYQKESDETLRVWPDGKLPADAVTEQQLIDFLKRSVTDRWETFVPHDASFFANYTNVFFPAWRHTLQLGELRAPVQAVLKRESHTPGCLVQELEIYPSGKSNAVTVLAFIPPKLARPSHPAVAILADPAGCGPYCDASDKPLGLAQRLIANGSAVWIIKEFSPIATGDPFTNFFTTYNRTLLQERVRDLVAVASAARSPEPGLRGPARVVLCGNSCAGLWALLAAPTADAVIADCNRLDTGDDHALLAPELFCPGLRNVGAFDGVAALAAPHPLLLHNSGRSFSTAALRQTYAALREQQCLRIESERLDEQAVARWISRLE